MAELTWTQPRRLGDYWAMYLEEWGQNAEGTPILPRYGDVTWNVDGTGDYRISMTYQVGPNQGAGGAPACPARLGQPRDLILRRSLPRTG